jgi:alpha-beta hydrolase superfamily lysophospholipase
MKSRSIILLIIILFINISVKAQYKEDYLKNGYEYRQIQMPNDYEGKVISTLVRKKSNQETKKAILYIHGFCDYFFNTEFSEVMLKEGYDFYALDLRKYGRSLLQSQHPNQARNLKEYYADIDSALKIIKAEGHTSIHINAHSTGGLIVVRYADARTGQKLFQSISLNSPFLDFNNSRFEEGFLVPVVTSIGSIAPKMKLPQGLSGLYGESIHKDYKGEWDFNLAWKPIIAFRMDAGWLRAINKSHKKVKRGLDIEEPIIVFSSDKSYYSTLYTDDIKYADAVLNVGEIQSRALKLGKNIDRKVIKKGMHDLSLSTLEVRKEYYAALIEWLKTKG